MDGFSAQDLPRTSPATGYQIERKCIPTPELYHPLHGPQTTRILRPRRRTGQFHQGSPVAGRGATGALAPGSPAGGGTAPEPADPQRPRRHADRGRQAAAGTRPRHPAPGRARARGAGPGPWRPGRPRGHRPAAQSGAGDDGAADACLPPAVARSQPVDQRRPVGHDAGMAAHRAPGHRGALQRHAGARRRDHATDGRRAAAGAAATAGAGRDPPPRPSRWPKWRPCRW